MDISELKKKIMDKIEEKKARGSGQDIALKILTKNTEAEVRASDAAKVDSDAVRREVVRDDVIIKAEVTKEEVTSENEAKEAPAKDEAAKIDAPGDEEVKRPSIKLGDTIEYQALKKSWSEYNEKLAMVEAENKELKVLMDEALKQRDSLIIQITEKNNALYELEKKIADSSDANRMTSSLNTDTLLKLQTSMAENRKLGEELSRLKLELESKDIRINELDALRNAAEAEKREAELRAQTSERERRDLEGKVVQLGQEMNAKNHRLEELERSYRDLDSIVEDTTLKIQTIKIENRNLEEKLSQLKLELETRDKRIVDSISAYKALETEKNEMMLKAQAAEIEKRALGEKISQFTLALKLEAERREKDKAAQADNLARLSQELNIVRYSLQEKDRMLSDMKQEIARLEEAIDSRDKKIETDIKYYERLAAEISELRQKSR